jgi:ABC-type transport system involved in multi-copper enzyme maturation permease subunit
MTVKELRQSLRRGSFVYPFLSIQLLSAVAMALEFKTGAWTDSSSQSGMLNIELLWSSGPFWMVVSLVCAFIMPMAGVVLMGQELEEGNHELLLLTQLDRWKVVIGKFAALWGLSVLTFVSLMPYVVVRYLVGGIEWWREASCGLSVLGVSAILAAGAIGASAFRRAGIRILVILLFLVSAAIGSAVPLGFSASQTDGMGILYHLTAVSAVICFTLLGLALARSRLRLVTHAYEVSPSAMIIGLICFAPLIIGMSTAFTGGYAGLIGLLGLALAAIYTDVTPKAPRWMPAPPPNLPTRPA